MSSLEERVAALEREIVRLREQVTDTHTLAAHADRDVAEFREELRAQTRVINALRETQVEQGDALTGLRSEVTGLRTEVTGLRTEVTARFDQLHGGLEHIVQLLGELGDQR